APASYQVGTLESDVFGDGTGPEIVVNQSGFWWQRQNLRIGGTSYAHGLSVHARSSVAIDLNGLRCTSFDAMAGVDDMMAGLGTVRFSVYGDGALLWRSGWVEGGDAAVPVHAGMSPSVKALRLVVEPERLLYTGTVSDWAMSRISCQ
ncbi:NPCBM/NEW2 domain-containing protein, partial [Streptomyces polyrhachis]